MDQTPTTLDLTPEIIHVEVQMGTDNELVVTLTNKTGTAVNITNDSVKFTAKSDFAGTNKIVTKTNGVGQHTDPASGKTTFVLTKTDLSTLTPADEETWKYEVRRVISGNNREVIYIHGDLILKPSVGLSA